MDTLRVDQTTQELLKRIEQHESALRLLPEGRVKRKLQEDLARLRSIVDRKQLLSVNDYE